MAKIVAYIPVHVEYDTEKKKKSLLRDLAEHQFGRYGGTYSYQKKKCRIKDIVIDAKTNQKQNK
jgi:hypothetical protein